MTPEDQDKLVQAALEVRADAYAPYSKFHVGAALLTTDGTIFRGVNVENISYGLTICAERVAMCSAVATGEREFAAIAISSPGGVTPCGACRQFLAEFCDDLPIVLVDATLTETDPVAAVRVTSLSVLLPEQFDEIT